MSISFKTPNGKKERHEAEIPIANSVIAPEELDNIVRAIWAKKCKQEAAEKKIPVTEAQVQVDVFLFTPYKSSTPQIYVETRRGCDLIADHIIFQFSCLPIAKKTFNDYKDYVKASLHTNTLNKEGFTVAFK